MKNFKRRFLWLLLLLVLGTLFWGVVEHHRRKWRLEAYKTELAKQGVEFDLAKLIPPLPSKDENGASLLSAGATQLKQRFKFGCVWPMKFVEADRAQIEWQQTQPEGNDGAVTWAELSSLLESNQVALQLVREAARKPRMNFGLDYSLGFSLKTSHVTQILRAEFGLIASALMRLRQDDVKGALTDIEDMLALVNLRKEERLMFAQFMALDSRYMTWAVSWEFLQKGNLNDEDSKRLQAAWSSTDAVESITKTVEFQRAFVLRSLNQARLDGESRREFFYVFDGWTIRKGDAPPMRNGSSIRSWIKHIWESTRHSTRYVAQEIEMVYWKHFTSYTDEEIYLRQITDLLGALKAFNDGIPANEFLPSYMERRRKSLEVHERKGRLLVSHRGIGHDIPEQLIYAESLRRLMLTAVALKRYQLEHGELPETLTDLLPAYLEAMPTDPADGKPLRYTRKADGEFLLYAIGMNLVDDGGDPSSEEDDAYDNLFGKKDWMWPMKMIEPGRAQVEWQQTQLDNSIVTQETWSDLLSRLESNKTALNQMRRALQKPRMNFGLNYSLGLSLKTPHLMQLTRLESVLTDRAVMRLQQDDVSGALADIEDMLTLIRLQDEDRLVYSQQRSLDISYMIWAVSWEFLQKKNLSDEELLRPQVAWRSMNAAERLGKAVEMERASMVESLNQARLDSDLRREFFSVFDRETIRKGDAPPARTSSSIRSWLKYLWTSTRHSMRYVIQEVEMTYWKYFTSYTDEEIYLQQVANYLNSFKAFSDNKPANDFLPPFIERRRESLAMHERKGRLLLNYRDGGRDLPQRLIYAESLRHLMVTAIALKRHQLKYGELPETLVDLVPDYLEAVPTDPADNQPLRYARKPRGEFLLYAVGINLQDEGGISFAENTNAYANLFGNKDWVWPMPVNEVANN